MKKSGLLFIFSSALCLLEVCGCGGSSAPPPPPPVISVALSPSSAQALDANQSSSLTATVKNDSSNQGVNWTVACPAGVSACGTVAQAKSASGVANQYIAPANVSAAEAVTVTATSVSDASKSAFTQVTVNPALAFVNPPPPQPQPGVVGGTFSYNLANFVQGGTAPLTWAIKSGTLPAGLVLDAKTGMITGTPTTATTTAAVIAFTLTDSGTPATVLPADPQIFLTINTPAALTITSGPPPDGTVNVQYGPTSLQVSKCFWNPVLGWHLVCTPCSSVAECGSLPPCTGSVGRSPCRKTTEVFPGFILTATGGQSGYTWTLAAGSSLPLDLNLAGNKIVGTPRQIGTFTFTITVSDSASPAEKISATYHIKIAPPPPPVIDAIPTLPIGTLNSPYVGFTFTATDGLVPLSWTATGLPAGLSLSTDGVLSGKPSGAAGSSTITIQVQDAAGQNSATKQTTIQILAKGFVPTGSMATARVWHTATLLINGKVLIPGGVNAATSITTAELYDPATAKFSQTTGSPLAERFSATATLMKSGKVLLVGGKGVGGELATAEVYDPATQTFAATTGNLSNARAYHTATLLNDGTVLVTGGLDPVGDPIGTPVASAEIYDPATGSFTLLAASMSTGRFFHTATLLGNGKVLIAGGLSGNGTSSAATDLYDPATKTFTPTGNMTAARAGHVATALQSGKVLLTGGAATFGGDSTATAELYNANTGSFTATNPMIGSRSAHTATLLNNGQVLVAGGSSLFYGAGGESSSLSSAELFDPATGNFTATADMTAIRESHTATLLGDGQVLVVGGSNGTLGYTPTTVLATAELY